MKAILNAPPSYCPICREEIHLDPLSLEDFYAGCTFTCIFCEEFHYVYLATPALIEAAMKTGGRYWREL